jgi:urease accessory protein
MWLASPALPVGGFSYSEGLEAAVEAGLVSTETQAGDWLLAQLQLSLARADLPALAAACAAWQAHDAAAVAAVNDWLRQTRESAEQRAQAEQMGRSLLDWLRNGMHAADPRLATLAALHPHPCGPRHLRWPLCWPLPRRVTRCWPLPGAGPKTWPRRR